MVPLDLLPVVLTFCGVAIAFWSTLTKFRARNDLSRALRGDDAALKALQNLLPTGVRGKADPNDLEAAAKLVRKHAAALSSAEQREVEAALDQKSATGRESYIRGLTP